MINPSDRFAWQLTSLEAAAGIAIGHSGVAALPDLGPVVAPRTAFEDVIREALLRPPCIVSFSGGRDSSAILAVASHLAQQEGYAPPIAVTLRFPAVASAEESGWQDAVVSHLGVQDWVVMDLHEEVDLLGPWAQEMFHRHGVLWPPNTHFHVPMVRAAAGGTLLTGDGGDEIMTPGMLWERVNRLLARQARPRASDLARIVAAYGPSPVRRAAIRHRWAPYSDASWLSSSARREVERLLEDDFVSAPVRFDQTIRKHWWPSRDRVIGSDSLRLLTEEVDATLLEPFTDPRYLSSVAGALGRNGPIDRASAMNDLVGDLLPGAMVNRRGKAYFDAAFWGPECKTFTSSWDGTGVDAELVDVEELRRIWQTQTPEQMNPRTLTLLQIAWVASNSATI